MKKLYFKGFKLIGMDLGHETSNYDGQSNKDAGKLWQKFIDENVQDKIPNRLGEEVYALYYHYKGDHSQPFRYFIGCKVEDGAPDINGLDSILIPDQHYIKLLAKGPMPDCVAKIWREIWAKDLDRAYQFDFERYGEASKDWKNAEVEVFLSTKKSNNK